MRVGDARLLDRLVRGRAWIALIGRRAHGHRLHAGLAAEAQRRHQPRRDGGRHLRAPERRACARTSPSSTRASASRPWRPSSAWSRRPPATCTTSTAAGPTARARRRAIKPPKPVAASAAPAGRRRRRPTAPRRHHATPAGDRARERPTPRRGDDARRAGAAGRRAGDHRAGDARTPATTAACQHRAGERRATTSTDRADRDGSSRPSRAAQALRRAVRASRWR